MNEAENIYVLVVKTKIVLLDNCEPIEMESVLALSLKEEEISPYFLSLVDNNSRIDRDYDLITMKLSDYSLVEKILDGRNRVE